MDWLVLFFAQRCACTYGCIIITALLFPMPGACMMFFQRAYFY
jgi:hypothetical protein